jgi:hypothetical protein
LLIVFSFLSPFVRTVAGAIGYYGQFSGIGQVGVGQVLTAGKGHGGGGY